MDDAGKSVKHAARERGVSERMVRQHTEDAAGRIEAAFRYLEDPYHSDPGAICLG